MSCFFSVLFALSCASVLSHTSKAKDAFERVLSNENPLLSVDVFLKPKDDSLLDSKFRSVSDPSRKSFGKFLSMSDVCSVVRPRVETVRSAHRLFQQASSVSHPFLCDNVLRVTGTRRYFEARFGTRVSLFRSKIQNSVQVWALDDEPIVPSYVALIHGLHLPVVVGSSSLLKNALFSDSYTTATPALLKKLYNVSLVVNATLASQGVAGWEHQSYSVGGLLSFSHICAQSGFFPPQICITFRENTGSKRSRFAKRLAITLEFRIWNRIWTRNT